MFQRIFEIKTLSEDVAIRGRMLKATALLIAFAALAVVVFGLQSLERAGDWWTSTTVMVCAMAVFGLAHWGYVRTGGVVLGAFILLAIITTQNAAVMAATRISMASLLPTLVTGLVVNSDTMLVFGGLTLVARLIAQTAIHHVPVDIITNDVVVMLVCIAITWQIFRTIEGSLRRANQRAEAALVAQRELSAQQMELQSKNGELAASNDQMTALLDLVRDLETPIMPLLDGVLVLPLVGHVDTRRASRLTDAALEAVHAQRAQVVLIDITGVSVVDTAVAQRISHLAHAIRLLGAKVMLTGIRADIAHTIVAQGIDFSHIQTAGRLQDGVASVLTSVRQVGAAPMASGRTN